MIFTWKKTYKLEAADFRESTEELANPGRGWYHIYPFDLDYEPDFEGLYWCLKAEEKLVLLIFDISAYSKARIPQEACQRMGRILEFFSGHGKEAIVRLTYDREGRCIEKEPDFLSQVEDHISTLGPVLQRYRRSILVFQGLGVGNWGELHGSKFSVPGQFRRLYEAWRRVLGPDLVIALRTPLQWRQLFSEPLSLDEPGLPDNIGIFHDGMFGSPDDLGTYGNADPEADLSWTCKWGRDRELEFLQKITKMTPYGGEAVGTDPVGSLQQAVRELRMTHAVYLNRAYDPARLEAWKQESWQGEDEWKGVDGCAYIGSHLGYRLLVRACSLRKQRQEMFLQIRLENTGFADFVPGTRADRDCRLLVSFQAQDREGGQAENLEAEMVCPKLEAGQTSLLEFPLGEVFEKKARRSIHPDSSWKLFMKLDVNGEKIIRLANQPDQDQTFLGVLLYG